MAAPSTTEEQRQKSYQPMLTFLAETKEYVGGELHNGDRPTGMQIARHVDKRSFHALCFWPSVNRSRRTSWRKGRKASNCW
jgi:hypothetical protein